MNDLQRLVAALTKEAEDDLVGLWLVQGLVRNRFSPKSESEERALILEAIRGLLNDGRTRTFNFNRTKSGKLIVEYWPEGIESIIARIQHDWNLLGKRDLNPGDIVDFARYDVTKYLNRNGGE